MPVFIKFEALLTYKNTQQIFLKTIKEKGIEYFKAAKVWLILKVNDF